MGHTAHILLEIDEAQDVGKEKYARDFKPMASTTNATTVLYGTAWDDTTLLEETRQTNLEMERKDGAKRHFSFDWQEVAKYNPDYLRYVEGERERLGEEHPLFRTQYRLLPLRGGGGFLSASQRAQMQGTHPRLHCAQPGRVYVAGIDLAGEVEMEEGGRLEGRHVGEHGGPPLHQKQDSTVLTIAEIELHAPLQDLFLPRIHISHHLAWTGKRHADLYPQLIDLLKNVWRCRRVVVDATGIGQPVYSYLREAVGGVVTPFVFSAPSKSELGFNLLAAVNSGRLKMYAADGSTECQEFWSQMERAKSYYRPSQTMNFFVPPDKGHDDFLMSLALAVEAVGLYEPRVAKGR